MSIDCQCPYHYDRFGCMGEACENEGTINVPGIGLICAQCYDEIDAALKTVSQELDELTVTEKKR
jgi:hypothetical protein